MSEEAIYQQLEVCQRQRDAAQSELTALKAELASEEKDHAELRDVVAALREELANKTAMLEAEQKWYDKEIDSADEETSSLRECIRDLKDWREHSQSFAVFESIIARAEAVLPSPGPLRKALTAAEQRNAELIKSIESINASASTAHVSQSLWKLKTVMASIARITDAALKPTESVVYQSREIGESDWEDCSKDEYDRCGKDPHMDTRIKPTESGASHVD